MSHLGPPRVTFSRRAARLSAGGDDRSTALTGQSEATQRRYRRDDARCSIGRSSPPRRRRRRSSGMENDAAPIGRHRSALCDECSTEAERAGHVRRASSGCAGHCHVCAIRPRRDALRSSPQYVAPIVEFARAAKYAIADELSTESRRAAVRNARAPADAGSSRARRVPGNSSRPRSYNPARRNPPRLAQLVARLLE